MDAVFEGDAALICIDQHVLYVRQETIPDDVYASLVDALELVLPDAADVRSIIYDYPDVAHGDADRRRRMADLMRVHRERLRETAIVVVTSSSVVRGIAKTMFWLAPLPGPMKTVATLQEAVEIVSSHDPRVVSHALLDKIHKSLADWRASRGGPSSPKDA